MQCRHALIAVLVLVIAGLVPHVEAADEREKAAKQVAESWLKTVDDGKYREGWQQAAEPIKKAITQDQWVEAIAKVRSSLGKPRSRTVKNTSFHDSLAGAPEGKYVVIQFQTDYENKPTAVETVTPMLEKDGKWRVAGYFIK